MEWPFVLLMVGLVVIFAAARKPSPNRPTAPTQIKVGRTEILNFDAMRVALSDVPSKAAKTEIPASELTPRSDARECYQQAFGRLASQLEGTLQPLEAILPELTEAYVSGDGDFRRLVLTVAQAWPDTLQWPACEAQFRQRAMQIREEYAEVISGFDIFDFLSGMKVPELRAMYARYAPTAKLLGRSKKADIVNSLVTDLSDEVKAKLLSEFKAQALRDFDDSADHNEWERAELFVQYLSSAASNLRHMAQAREIARYRPLWKFVAEPDSAPTECKARDGMCFRFDDPIWERIAPCDHPQCRCRFHAVAPAQA